MSDRFERFVENPETRLTILKFSHSKTARANLTPDLVLALTEVESHFDEFAISVAGARDLMQIMKFWFDEINFPNTNLKICRFIYRKFESRRINFCDHRKFSS